MIYVHVPFCRSFCTYCGFYSEAAPRCRRQEDILRQEALFEDYVKAVTAEAGARQDYIDRVFASDDADTLYIGGGTPSVLSLSAFDHILKALGHDQEDFLSLLSSLSVLGYLNLFSLLSLSNSWQEFLLWQMVF